MKKILTVVLLSAFAAPAFAANSGFYAGVDLGRSSTSNIGATALTQSKDTVLGVLGGYQINKNFAAEAFLTGTGKFAAGAASGKTDAYGIDAIGILPLSDAFSLYGKLGVARTKTSLSNAAPSTGAKRTAATYGLGGQYNVTPAIGVRLGWDRYGAAINNGVGGSQNFNTGVWSVAGVFKF